jgi:putative membrane protein
MKQLALVATAATLTMVISACGEGRSPATPSAIGGFGGQATASSEADDSAARTHDHGPLTGPGAFGGADQRAVLFEAQIHEAEIQMSMVAERDGDHPHVKWLAQQIAQDHRDALQGLRDAAPDHVPASINLTTTQHNAHAAMLQLRGSALDRVYLEEMISAHQEAIAVLQTFATAVGHSALRNHILEQIPAMRRHLTMARDAAGFVGANPQGTNRTAGGASASQSGA